MDKIIMTILIIFLSQCISTGINNLLHPRIIGELSQRLNLSFIFQECIYIRQIIVVNAVEEDLSLIFIDISEPIFPVLILAIQMFDDIKSNFGTIVRFLKGIINRAGNILFNFILSELFKLLEMGSNPLITYVLSLHPFVI